MGYDNGYGKKSFPWKILCGLFIPIIAFFVVMFIYTTNADIRELKITKLDKEQFVEMKSDIKEVKAMLIAHMLNDKIPFPIKGPPKEFERYMK